MTCAALHFDDGASLADGLVTLDCRSSEATSHAFARLFGIDGALLPALTIALTLYIAIFAIGLLTGRSKVGIASLTPRMLTLGLTLTFATSWIAYQNVVWTLAVGAPDQLASILVGSHGSATMAFATRFDQIFNAISDLASQGAAVSPADVSSKATVDSNGFFSPHNLLWMSDILLMLGTVGVLATSKIALSCVLAIGPFFVNLALFRATRGLFEGWLKATVMLALIPMFAVTIGSGSLAVLEPLVQGFVAEGGEISARSAAVLFMIASIYCALMFMALKTAGLMVAGWRIMAGEQGQGARQGAAALHYQAATLAVPTALAAQRGEMSRVHAITSHLSQVSSAALPDRFVGQRQLVSQASAVAVHIAATSRTTIGDERLRSVGSRFRQAPSQTLRDAKL